MIFEKTDMIPTNVYRYNFQKLSKKIMCIKNKPQSENAQETMDDLCSNSPWKCENGKNCSKFK